MKSESLAKLKSESYQEYSALLILDQLMRYELPSQEERSLKQIILQLEKEVMELEKGFFHTDEHEQELIFKKDELMQANEAMIEIKKEINNNEQCRLNLALLETGDRGLEPILNFMEETGTISVNEENYYLPTKKGKELYQQLVDQLEAYVIHFDIYAFVDLEKGTFGDPKNDLLELSLIHI